MGHLLELATRLRTQPTMTARQKRLLALYDTPHRSAEDDLLLQALATAEVSRFAALEASAAVRRTLTQRSGIKRRTRVRQLIEFGGLAPIAGVLDFDRAVVLGALLAIHQADSQTIATWKGAGNEALSRASAEKRNRRAV